jgi:Ribbon-helix-helix protein, copG family
MTSRSGSENRRRNIVLHIRVDEIEKALLDRAAEREGVSVPELLRRNTFRNIRTSQEPTVRRQSKRSPASSHRAAVE